MVSRCSVGMRKLNLIVTEKSFLRKPIPLSELCVEYVVSANNSTFILHVDEREVTGLCQKGFTLILFYS